MTKHMILEAFNEYESNHENFSNVLHVGFDTYAEIVKLILSCAPNEEEKLKAEAEYATNSGPVFGRLMIVHTDIPRMMIADCVDEDTDLSTYPKEFLAQPETLRRLIAMSEVYLSMIGEAKLARKVPLLVHPQSGRVLTEEDFRKLSEVIDKND